LPVIVKGVVEPAGPYRGAMDAMVGAGSRYVYPPVSDPARLSGLVTFTSTTPAAPAVGVVAVMWLESTTTTPVAEFVPMVTVAPYWKP